MNGKPRVAVLMKPEQRYENIDDQFFDAVGDRCDLVMQESDAPTDEEILVLIGDADAIVTGWGSPTIAPHLIAQAKRLGLHGLP